MSKRSSDARGSSDAKGSMDVDPEGEAAAKQKRTKKWLCARCKKEFDEVTEYYIRWWTEGRVAYFCMECTRKFEEEEAEKKRPKKE